MHTEGKIRIVISIVIFIILAYFSIGYTYELYHFGLEELYIDAGNINDIDITGSDFTPLFRLVGAGVNSFVGFLTAGIYAFVILAVSLILLLPYRLIALNKKREVSEKEGEISKRCYQITLFFPLLFV